MRSFLRLALFVVIVVLPGVADSAAQDPPPDLAPAPTATPGEYPDIDALRQPGSSAKFLPPEPTPSASALTGPAVPARAGRRNSGLPTGQHRPNERANDLLADQADADPLVVRVAYRRAKTAVMARDPGLAELLRQAADAPTDPQKRAILKIYYTRLYAEVQKADPSPEMKKHVALLSSVSQQRYDPQRRAVGGEEDIVRGGGGRRGKRGGRR